MTTTYTLIRDSDGVPLVQVTGDDIALPEAESGTEWIETKSPGPPHVWDAATSTWVTASAEVAELAWPGMF